MKFPDFNEGVPVAVKIRRGLPGFLAATYDAFYYHDPEVGVTLGTTPSASGSSPPVTTISGALTPARELYYAIDSVVGGTARGQATFKWGLSGSAGPMSATGVLTAATTPLVTPNGTITIAWPVGTYGTSQEWKATVAAHADASAGAIDMAQADAARQPLFKGTALNGRPGIAYAGHWLDSVVFTSVPHPRTVFCVVKLNSTSQQVFMDGTAAGRQLLYLNSETTIGMGAGGTDLNPSYTPGTTTHIWTGIFNGASSSILIDGVTIASGDPGNAAIVGLRYGDYFGAPAVPLDGIMGPSFAFKAVMSASDIAYTVARLKRMYGIH